MSNDKNVLHGKPWTNNSTHDSYESATRCKESLSEDLSLQVKVRRRPDGTYTVKTRSVTFDAPKEKKVSKGTGKPNSKSEKRKMREQRKKQKSQG